MYKDVEKQKQANREAARRRRARAQGMTQGMTKQGMTRPGMTGLPDDVQIAINRACDERVKAGKPDDRALRVSSAIAYQKLYPDVDSEGKDRAYRHINPRETMDMGFHVPVVGKPGDADYDGIVTPEWRAERCA